MTGLSEISRGRFANHPECLLATAKCRHFSAEDRCRILAEAEEAKKVKGGLSALLRREEISWPLFHYWCRRVERKKSKNLPSKSGGKPSIPEHSETGRTIRLKACLESGKNILIVGPAAAGKGALARQAAGSTPKKIQTVDFLEKSGNIVETLSLAARNGNCLLLENMEWAQGRRFVIGNLLSLGKYRKLHDMASGQWIEAHQDFRMIATIHSDYFPPEDESLRSLLRHFVVVDLEKYQL